MENADVSDTMDMSTVLEPLKTAFCVRFAQGYERRAVCQKNERFIRERITFILKKN
jgi:hypothetical protein